MAAIKFFRGARFIGSCVNAAGIPGDGRSLVAITGRSNSGKSTLLSALCDHKNLAKSSRTAGKTRLLNCFSVPTDPALPSEFFLVDMPGYGFANISKAEQVRLRTMVDRFLLEAKNLVLIILVLDARRALGEEERNIINFCRDADRACILARTKWDRLNAAEKNAAKKRWKADDLDGLSYPVSSPKKIGLDNILSAVRCCIQPD